MPLLLRCTPRRASSAPTPAAAAAAAGALFSIKRNHRFNVFPLLVAIYLVSLLLLQFSSSYSTAAATAQQQLQHRAAAAAAAAVGATTAPRRHCLRPHGEVGYLSLSLFHLIYSIKEII